MAETALAFAMKNAGVNTNAALLRSIAFDELHKADRVVARALSRFTEEVRDAGGIMAELVPYAVTRDLARAYLEEAVGEMLKVPAKAGDGVHSPREGQTMVGPVENSEGEAAHPTCGSHSKPGHLSSDPVRDGAVQPRDDRQSDLGRVVPIPNKPRSLADRERINKILSNSYFDTVKFSDGSVSADTPWGMLRRQYNGTLFDQSLRESCLKYVQVSDDTVRPRDVIPLKVYEAMVNAAREKGIANAI